VYKLNSKFKMLLKLYIYIYIYIYILDCHADKFNKSCINWYIKMLMLNILIRISLFAKCAPTLEELVVGFFRSYIYLL